MATLGDYGCDYDYELIVGVSEMWCNDLREMSQIDALFLIANIANELWLEHPENNKTTATAKGVQEHLNFARR